MEIIIILLNSCMTDVPLNWIIVPKQDINIFCEFRLWKWKWSERVLETWICSVGEDSRYRHERSNCFNLEWEEKYYLSLSVHHCTKVFRNKVPWGFTRRSLTAALYTELLPRWLQSPSPAKLPFNRQVERHSSKVKADDQSVVFENLWVRTCCFWYIIHALFLQRAWCRLACCWQSE